MTANAPPALPRLEALAAAASYDPVNGLGTSSTNLAETVSLPIPRRGART